MSATASTDIVKVDDGQTTENAIDAPSSRVMMVKLQFSEKIFKIN